MSSFPYLGDDSGAVALEGGLANQRRGVSVQSGTFIIKQAGLASHLNSSSQPHIFSKKWREPVILNLPV